MLVVLRKMIGYYAATMTVYFTSDTHFGHTNIIKFSKRPYNNEGEMNDALIKNWNAVVQPNDVVYHLGDFSWNGYQDVFHRLKGQKHLIIGNHDRASVMRLPWASQPKHYDEIKVKTSDGIEYDVVLFHYPIEEWNGFYHGAVHLHGHVHGKKMKDNDRIRVDVAVECFNYAPATLDQILASVPNT
jgi:calcineurin-like phosphoesterase family protein